MTQPLSQRYIVRFWLPLAAMWLLMALEQPMLSAVIARLAEPRLNLAAYGLTFSLALIVESPVIMFLTMSTALARSRQSYGLLLRFTHLMAWGLTALHLAVGLTPAYAFIVGRLIGAPAEVIEPSRVAFLLMTPWAGSIAYRRFWQGVLIRFGHTQAVALTTAIRLAATAAVALAGLRVGTLSGANLAGVSVSAGVLASALAAWLFVRPVVRRNLGEDDPAVAALTWRFLLGFYVPLALTSLINLGGQPIISFGLSRAALPLASLAVWPVVNGLLFLLRSSGVALQEVIVALLGDQQSFLALRRFSYALATALSSLMAIITLTPLANLWFVGVAGLSGELAQLAGTAAPLLILVPGLTALVSWQRGLLVHFNHTSPITVATALNVGTLLVTMLLAVALLPVAGIIAATLALTASLLVETAYLTWRARARRLTIAWA